MADQSADSTLRLVRTDYASHRDAMLQRVRSRWPGVWNDFTANSLAMMYVDLTAWTTQTWAYLVNSLANEGFTPTMQLRESAVRIGGQYGYKLRGPVPSSVMCEAWLSAPASGDPDQVYLKIPAGTVIRAGQSPFETPQDYYIYGGQTTPITPIVTFDAAQSGSRVLSTNVRVQNGLDYVDLVDQSVDAGLYVLPGQSLRRTSGDTAFYTVSALEAPSTPGVYNRIYLEADWASSPAATAEVISVEVVDRRIAFTQGQSVEAHLVSRDSEGPLLRDKLSQG